MVVAAMAAPVSSVGRRRSRFGSMFREGPLPEKVAFPGKVRLVLRDSQLSARRDEDEGEKDEEEVVVKREGSWHCDGNGNRGVAVTFDILEQK